MGVRKRLRPRIRVDDTAVAVSIGTSLLVVITVAMAVIVALFMTGLVKFPESVPELDVTYSHVGGRWTVHFTKVSEELSLEEFKVIVRHSNSSEVEFDSDADTVWDEQLMGDLSDYAVSSADGPQSSPLVFVDVDTDGKVSTGDILVAYGPYFAPISATLDATRGYRDLAITAQDIPKGSWLALVASPDTLGSADIHPGDTVRVDLMRGGTLKQQVQGTVTSSGVYVGHMYLDPDLETAIHSASFFIRPGEVDEWHINVPVHVHPEDPLTSEEEEHYDNVINPLGDSDRIVVVHNPSNSVVLEFSL
jgi:FlaG/FlaF family flagellin (archaellin)